jgi:hypothetical protein
MKNKFFHWLPRGLGLILVFLFFLFSFDVFEMEGSWLELLGGFLIHNISTLVLALLLALAWKKERMGGIVLIFASLGFLVFFRGFSFFLLFPAAIGTLFLINSYLKNER